MSPPRIIDSQSRVVVPPEALRALNLVQGSWVVFELDGQGVSMRRVTWQVDTKHAEAGREP